MGERAYGEGGGQERQEQAGGRSAGEGEIGEGQLMPMLWEEASHHG